MSISTPRRPVADVPAAVSRGTVGTPSELDGTPGRPPPGGHGEVAALTGLRIVAALWVVAFHFHFTPIPGVATVSDWLGPLVTQGALGVDLFFVLSGFVIAWTYLDQLGPRLRARATGRFVWARVARMWPAYAVVFHLFGIWLVARAVVGGTDQVAYQAVQPSLSAGAWLEQLLGVQMWTEEYLDGASWVGPTWSISAEWLAYLLFPLLAPAFLRLQNLPFAVLAAGSVLCVTPIAAAFVVVGSPYYPYSWLVRLLGGFSAGVLAMLAVRRLRGRPSRAATASAASSVATLAAVAVPFVLLAGTAYGHGLHGLAVLLFPVLVGALALADRGPVHHLLTRAPVVHGGRISYALYLVHIPVFEVFWFLGETGVLPAGGETGHLIALTVFVGTLPVAHLLYTLVERPARRWLRVLPTRRAAAAPGGRADHPVTSEPRAAHVDTAAPRAAHVDTAAPRAAHVDTAAPRAAHVDTAAARRDPETCVLPAVDRAGGPRLTTADARRDPATSVLPVITAHDELTGPARPATGPGSGAPRGGVVPAPRALRSAAALPGSRSGVENCRRGTRRRDDAHASAVTPILAASGAAARRRRKRPAHGV